MTEAGQGGQELAPDEVEAAFEAARDGDVEGVSAHLLADRSIVRARGAAGVTLLHVAAERNDRPLAELLLSAGAELEAEAPWGYTPFEWAAAMAADDVARLLLDRGAERLNLWTAAALGLLDEVRACFVDGAVDAERVRRPVPGADLTGWPDDAPYRTGDGVSDAFHIAARNGRKEVAAFLLERGAHVDAIGYFGATALQWAAVAGREEIVRWLVARGADRRRRDPRFGGDAASWARQGGHEALAAYLQTEE